MWEQKGKKGTVQTEGLGGSCLGTLQESLCERMAGQGPHNTHGSSQATVGKQRDPQILIPELKSSWESHLPWES